MQHFKQLIANQFDFEFPTSSPFFIALRWRTTTPSGAPAATATATPCRPEAASASAGGPRSSNDAFSGEPSVGNGKFFDQFKDCFVCDHLDGILCFSSRLILPPPITVFLHIPCRAKSVPVAKASSTVRPHLTQTRNSNNCNMSTQTHNSSSNNRSMAGRTRATTESTPSPWEDTSRPLCRGETTPP